MEHWQPDWSYVVVVVHGTGDVSRTVWKTSEEAVAYMEKLREQGFPTANLHLYRARQAKPSSPFT